MNALSHRCAPAAVTFLLATTTFGLINPDFTPLHLVAQSGAILILRTDAKADGAALRLTVERALNGEAPAALRLDLGPLDAPLRNDLAALLADAKAGPALVFVSTGGLRANLHAAGRWFPLAPGDGGAWNVVREDADMNGLPATWRGGSDMLARCVAYIVAFPDEAEVPSEAGIGWRDAKRIGQVAGDVSDLAVVELRGDGPTFLHVASVAGDVLIRACAGSDAPRDATEEVGLKARSVASARADYDGDGRLDLASYDGRSLALWLQGEGGAFAARRVALELPAGVHTLAVIHADEDAQPDLAGRTRGRLRPTEERRRRLRGGRSCRGARSDAE